MNIGNVKLDNPYILAPMAGVTDLPFRLLCKEQGAGLLCMEMVSAKALQYNNKNTKALINIIREDPFKIPPPYEKLVGDLQGLYYRRINLKHRLVYEVLENDKIVKIISLWTHYEK